MYASDEYHSYSMSYKGDLPANASGPPSSQFSKEVFNPTNPVEIPVDDFTAGSRLRVVLKVLGSDDGRFKINLRRDDDVLLHFNPRVKDKVLVFNSYSNGSWSYEERAAVLFPFEKKRIYTVELFGSKTKEDSILVYVNGHFLYEFHLREPGAMITAVEVAGDIFIHSIHIS